MTNSFIYQNDHTDAVCNTVIYNNCEATPLILESVSLDSEAVRLQMEDTTQDIQATTSNYLVNTPTPEKNILDNADYTIKYIKEFLQPHHSYTKSPTTQDGLNPDLRT